jgi:hypothetical protein
MTRLKTILQDLDKKEIKVLDVRKCCEKYGDEILYLIRLSTTHIFDIQTIIWPNVTGLLRGE